jgi:hypothetical protein
VKRRFHPLDIGVRIFSAVVGGYLLTRLSAKAAAAVLPMDGGEASIAASLGAWILFLGVVIWAFAARTPLRAAAPPGLAIILLFAATR